MECVALGCQLGVKFFYDQLPEVTSNSVKPGICSTLFPVESPQTSILPVQWTNFPLSMLLGATHLPLIFVASNGMFCVYENSDCSYEFHLELAVVGSSLPWRRWHGENKVAVLTLGVLGAIFIVKR